MLHEVYLGPLLFLGELVAYFAGGETTLRTEVQAVEGNVLRGLANAGNDLLAVFQGGLLGGNESQHHLFAFGNLLQGFETARPLVVVLQIEGIDVLAGKDVGSHSIVGALGGIGGMVVATADVGVDDHVLGPVFEGKVVHAQVAFGLALERKAGGLHELPEVVVHDHAPGAVVKLNVVAAGGMQVAYHLAVGLGDVLLQLGQVGVHALGVERVVATEKLGQKLCRSWKGLPRHDTLLLELLYKLEVLHKRMILAADLSREAQRPLGRLLAMELVAALQLDVLHAAESPHEIQVPVAAAELAIGNDLQAVSLLLGNEVGNQTVFYGLQRAVVYLALGVLGTGLLQLLRTQKTTYDVCTEW